jgi:predicted small secreted protein
MGIYQGDKYMKKISVLKWGVFILFAANLMLFSGCRTAEGFGRDVESAGESIQREAR